MESIKTGKSRSLLVPEDLVEGSDDEHDCSVLGSWAAGDRVFSREYFLLALIRLSCSTRTAFNHPPRVLMARSLPKTQLDLSVWDP